MCLTGMNKIDAAGLMIAREPEFVCGKNGGSA